jgi:hypothetical protein
MTEKLPYIYGKLTVAKQIENVDQSVRNTYDEYFSKKDEKAIKYDTSVHILESKDHLMEKSFEMYINDNEHVFT